MGAGKERAMLKYNEIIMKIQGWLLSVIENKDEAVDSKQLVEEILLMVGQLFDIFGNSDVTVTMKTVNEDKEYIYFRHEKEWKEKVPLVSVAKMKSSEKDKYRGACIAIPIKGNQTVEGVFVSSSRRDIILRGGLGKLLVPLLITIGGYLQLIMNIGDME